MTRLSSSLGYNWDIIMHEMRFSCNTSYKSSVDANNPVLTESVPTSKVSDRFTQSATGSWQEVTANNYKI